MQDQVVLERTRSPRRGRAGRSGGKTTAACVAMASGPATGAGSPASRRSEPWRQEAFWQSGERRHRAWLLTPRRSNEHAQPGQHQPRCGRSHCSPFRRATGRRTARQPVFAATRLMVETSGSAGSQRALQTIVRCGVSRGSRNAISLSGRALEHVACCAVDGIDVGDVPRPEMQHGGAELEGRRPDQTADARVPRQIDGPAQTSRTTRRALTSWRRNRAALVQEARAPGPGRWCRVYGKPHAADGTDEAFQTLLKGGLPPG